MALRWVETGWTIGELALVRRAVRPVSSGMSTRIDARLLPAAPVHAESLVTVLGTVYVHTKTSDGGDLYLTRFGLPHADLLDVANWYETGWFTAHRERLEGTSSVYRVPTKPVAGRSLDLVVKNCRVGEDVPLDTHTLEEFINAEFNSPWEEFALVMELRDSKRGDPDRAIHTQEPLAIYVPPERMQPWQSGRSQSKINRIRAKHPGIDIDILRQYKLIYGWIHGRDIIEALEDAGFANEALQERLAVITMLAIRDLDRKGYVVADMKPAHIIIKDAELRQLGLVPENADPQRKADALHALVEQGRYAVIDYELLLRTPAFEEEVGSIRRHSYLDDQRDRFTATAIPPHLHGVEVFNVPYIHGHAESTGGQLWVVGRNARLFDYFFPERWRKTPAWKLSDANEVYYTLTKDHIHLVWKTSRVGELPDPGWDEDYARAVAAVGFNSPFEEFAIAQRLAELGVPTVYVRAIYMTGSAKLEASGDLRRYESHRHLVGADGLPLLRQDRNYITLRGYFNGSDSWVASRTGALCRPVNLLQAVARELIDRARYQELYEGMLRQLRAAGYDGSLLRGNDMLLAVEAEGNLLRNEDGQPQVRICNFELIRPLASS
jgi:hypothetical protein